MAIQMYTVVTAGAGTEAFCSGGDQSVRGKGGYVGADGIARLNVLDLQVLVMTLLYPFAFMLLCWCCWSSSSACYLHYLL